MEENDKIVGVRIFEIERGPTTYLPCALKRLSGRILIRSIGGSRNRVAAVIEQGKGQRVRSK